MNLVEEDIAGFGGLRLHTLRALVEAPRGALAVVHGYGEHCGRHAGVVELANRLGLCCYLYDQRGHGRSSGRRGAIASWDDYLEDLAAFLAWADGQPGGPPRALLGHSMGGLVAASYLLERPHGLRLLILSSPLFALATPVRGARLAQARVASRLAPWLSLATAIKPEMLSHDPEVVANYASDPLVHRVANARWFTEQDAAQARCLARAAELKVESLLVMYGQEDRLVDPGGAERFFQAVTVADRQRLAYAGLRHEIFNEVERQKPLGDLERWLGQRM